MGGLAESLKRQGFGLAARSGGAGRVEVCGRRTGGGRKNLTESLQEFAPWGDGTVTRTSHSGNSGLCKDIARVNWLQSEHIIGEWLVGMNNGIELIIAGKPFRKYDRPDPGFHKSRS